MYGVFLDRVSRAASETGFYQLPLSPNLLRLSEAIDSRNSSSECLSPDSTPVTSICSHSMGTLSALNIVFTDSATSAPIPSPSVRQSALEVQSIIVLVVFRVRLTRNQGRGIFTSISAQTVQKKGLAARPIPAGVLCRLKNVRLDGGHC